MNNAAWCDLICRLHGRPGEFRRGVWLNRYAVPSFYPNAVTLADSLPIVEAAIGELATVLELSGWALKDSFGSLDLSRFGLQLLFNAEWILRPPSRPAAGSKASNLRWGRVRSASELVRWEQAWRQTGNIPENDAWKRMFPAALVEQPDVAVLSAHRGDGVIAGAIANLAAGHVGLTNIFAVETETAGTLAGCVQLAMTLFPDRSLVGYESGGRLETMVALGFEPIGPLAVWLMPAARGP